MLKDESLRDKGFWASGIDRSVVTWRAILRRIFFRCFLSFSVTFLLKLEKSRSPGNGSNVVHVFLGLGNIRVQFVSVFFVDVPKLRSDRLQCLSFFFLSHSGNSID